MAKKPGGGDQLGPITIHISANIGGLKDELKAGLTAFDDFIDKIKGDKATKLTTASEALGKAFEAVNVALGKSKTFVNEIITPFKNLGDELKRCAEYAQSFVGALDKMVGHGIKVADVMRTMGTEIANASEMEAKIIKDMMKRIVL